MKVSLTVGANTNSTKQRSHTYWHTKSKIFPGCGRMGRQFSRIFRNYYHYPITDIVCKKQKFSIGSVWASCWKLRVFYTSLITLLVNTLCCCCCCVEHLLTFLMVHFCLISSIFQRRHAHKSVDQYYYCYWNQSGESRWKTGGEMLKRSYSNKHLIVSGW